MRFNSWLLFSFFFNFKNRQRYFALLMLAVYLFLSLCSTLLFRSQSEIPEYNFTPFWSYREIKKGWTYLLHDNIYKVLLFIPVGFFLRFLSKKINVCHALLFSLFVSTMIETIQFFSKRGFAETDDVIHNVFGCFLGFCLCVAIQKIFPCSTSLFK